MNFNYFVLNYEIILKEADDAASSDSKNKTSIFLLDFLIPLN